jgi:hypothetical protein
MPQLPSGRHVSVSIDAALATARKGDLGLSIGWKLTVKQPADIAPLISIVYYRAEGELPTPECPDLGQPYLSGLTVADIGEPKCDWPAADQVAFREWLFSPRAQDWIRQAHEDLGKLIETVKPPTPEALHGILEDDD